MPGATADQPGQEVRWAQRVFVRAVINYAASVPTPWTPRVQAATHSRLRELTQRARQASGPLRELDRATKDKALLALADALARRRSEILAANAADLAAGPGSATGRPSREELTLTRQRLEDLAYGLTTTAAAPDPIGEVLHSRRQRAGVQLHQVRVPIGVVAVCFEGQPATVVRAIGVMLKTGNTLILQDCLDGIGRCDDVLVRIAAEVLDTHGVPADAVQLMPGNRRADIKASMRHLFTAHDQIDLVVPLLVRGVPVQLSSESSVPIVEIGAGNCHIYVDAAADLELAAKVVLDSKVDQHGQPGAAAMVLVHADVAPRFAPVLLSRLRKHGVRVHGDQRFAALAPGCKPDTEVDWRTGFRSPDLAATVVDSLAEATTHIARFGTRHTETVVTGDAEVARTFTARVDAATVTVNAPGTFAHSAANPLDPALGYSTQRLHPRGPLNLSGFTTTKWVAWPARHDFTPLPVEPGSPAQHNRIPSVPTQRHASPTSPELTRE